MMGRGLELLRVPMRAARRTGIVWGLSLVALIVLTVAFYPAFRDEPELSGLIEGMPDALVEAFGLSDFGTPAGFLRGNLYAVLVPLLMAVAGVLIMNGQTAADEDAGRMEVYLAQPVRRASVFLGRAGGVGLWIVIIGLFMLAGQLAADAAFGLDIDAARVVTTIVLCTLLGLFHAGFAAAVAGWLGRPGIVLGVGMALAVAGYVAVALFPLSDVLEPWKHASPWDWALGGDPLVNATEPWRYLALGVPALLMAVLGAFTFTRRDVSAA